MSNPRDNVFDMIVPPKKTDFALASFVDEEVDEDSRVPEGYDFDTHLQTWACLTCGAAVSNTVLHTSWHVHLDKMLPPA